MVRFIFNYCRQDMQIPNALIYCLWSLSHCNIYILCFSNMLLSRSGSLIKFLSIRCTLDFFCRGCPSHLAASYDAMMEFSVDSHFILLPYHILLLLFFSQLLLLFYICTSHVIAAKIGLPKTSFYIYAYVVYL